MLGTLAVLKERNLCIPGQVSFAVLFPDASFDWWQPTLAHCRWSEEPFIKHLVRWLSPIAEGCDYVEQEHLEALFEPGATIGAARR